MDPRKLPAVLPVIGLVAGLAVSRGPIPVPVWEGALLIAGGVALGGGGGAVAAGCGGGLLLGADHRVEQPAADPDRVTEAQGKVCGVWRRNGAFPSSSARLCPDWLLQGPRLLLHPPPLWLDLVGSNDLPAVGSSIRVRGALRRFPGYANRDPVRSGPWRLRVKSRLFVHVVERPSPAARAANSVRRQVVGAFAAAGRRSRPGLALTRAFVLGDPSALGESRRRALRRAGLAHLLAVSGFHVSVLVLAAALAGGCFGRRAGSLAPLPLVALYLAAVGPAPSMLRAAAMAAVAAAALSSRRTAIALQSLALAAAALLLRSPADLADVGFQLSFGATAGLVLLGARWTSRLRPLPLFVAAAFATTLAAQTGAWPFSVAAFSSLSPAAPVFNLVAAPWATVAILLAFGWTFVALVSPAAARVALPMLDLAARPLDGLVRLPRSPLVSLWVPAGIGGVVAAMSIVALVELPPSRRRLALLALAGLGLGGAATPSATRASVSFLDVGQGDAALVRAGRWRVLIDGGGAPGRDVGREVLWPALGRSGATAVDVVIVSHPDRDHCGGLLDLSAVVPIHELWTSAAAAGSVCSRLLATRADRSVVLATGSVLERGPLRFEIVHAGEARRKVSASRSDNDESVVVRLSVGGRRLLFTGDIEATTERRLVRTAYVGLRCDLLKVAHHGSATSSEGVFVDATRARVGVVSVGATNAFGHPSREVMERLRLAGLRLLRTDLSGEIDWRQVGSGPWRLELPGTPRQVNGAGPRRR